MVSDVWRRSSRTGRVQSGMVFKSVLSSFVHRGHKSTSFLSVAMEECNKGREGEKRGESERERKERSAEPEMEFGLRQETCCCAAVGSARAVGGRRLSSRDAHNQFFCKRGRGTAVKMDSGKRTAGGVHALMGGTAH